METAVNVRLRLLFVMLAAAVLVSAAHVAANQDPWQVCCQLPSPYELPGPADLQPAAAAGTLVLWQ
jgi:hypothetical protein